MKETTKDTPEEKDRHMPVVKKPDSAEIEIVKPNPLVAYEKQEVQIGKRSGIKNRKRRTTLSREQLATLLLENIEALSDYEARLLRSVLALNALTAQEVMVPLSELAPLTIASTLAEVRRTFNYRYVPIYNERIDHLLGVVDTMEALTTEAHDDSLAPFVRDILYVPSLKSAMDLLGELRQSEIPAAIVVNERGSCIGIVELIDIVEKMIGEITANHRRDLPQIENIGTDEWRIDARALIIDVNIALNIQMPTDRCDTIGGFILTLIGRIPQAGEKVEYEDYEFNIEAIFKYGISQIQALKRTS